MKKIWLLLLLSSNDISNKSILKLQSSKVLSNFQGKMHEQSNYTNGKTREQFNYTNGKTREQFNYTNNEKLAQSNYTNNEKLVQFNSYD